MNLPDKWAAPDGTVRPDYRARCYDECTAAAIFLLQRLRYDFLGPPNGYVYDSDADAVHAEDDPEKQLSLKDMAKMEQPGGLPCVIEHWDVDTVWLSRQEAADFAQRHAYNFSNGWRVYAVCAKGELAGLIKLT